MSAEPQILEEYRLFQERKAFYADKEACVIALEGADRASFLHNFCTADIKQLQPGDLTEAFILNTKGKTLAFVQVIASENCLQIVAPTPQSELIAGHLSKYVLVEDVTVQLQDVEVIYSMEATENAHPTHVASGLFLTICGGPDYQESHSDFVAVSKETFEMVRVENRFPLSGVDVLDVNLAQEFERDETAISFTKGCYLGQETVARLDALGHTNKAFRLAKVTGPKDGSVEFSELSSGTQAPLTFEEKECGLVTSASWSPKHGAYVVLAMIKKPHHQPDSALNWGAMQVTVI